jgi:hypothetical protein
MEAADFDTVLCAATAAEFVTVLCAATAAEFGVRRQTHHVISELHHVLKDTVNKFSVHG